MILISVILLATWVYGPKWLHPVVLAMPAVLAVVLGLLAWRYAMRDREALEHWESRNAYHWRPDWGVQTYHRMLMTWLKINDWKILAAEAVDNDRLVLMVTRDKHRLPLLLLRPGLAADETEIARLRDFQQRERAWEGALVAARAPRLAPLRYDDDATVQVLDYEDLPDLADALAGGPEEERRRRAALIALVEEEERKADAVERVRAAQRQHQTAPAETS